MQQSTREAGKTSTAEETFSLEHYPFFIVSELAEGKALDQINSMRTILDPSRLHCDQL